MIKPRKTFHPNPPISSEGTGMDGLTSLEVYKNIFNITEENNKFELYTDTFDEISFIKLKGEVAKILHISDITPYHLKHETIAPLIIELFKKLKLERASTDGYCIFLPSYLGSPFRDFKSYLRIVFGLDEEAIKLSLKQYNFNFVTYDITPGIYKIKDFPEAVYTMGEHEGSIKIEYDDVSMRTKLTFKHIGTLIFDKKSFFHTTFLGFAAYWDYKPTNKFHSDGYAVNTLVEF